MDPDVYMQAGSAFVMLIAGGFAGWRAWKAERRANQAAESAGTAERTLTTNNGGSHVRDALDRIEARQELQSERLTELGAEQRLQRTDLREHIRDARAWELQADARLRAVEQTKERA